MHSARAPQAQAEQVLAQEPHRDARAARIDAPAALDADRRPCAPRSYSCRRLVAIRERRVRARVVAVRLAQPRVRHDIAQADRIGLAQRVEAAAPLAEVRQRLRVAQMRVHVHEADLAAEEGAALGALEVALQAALIGERPVEQARAVGRKQVRVESARGAAGLLAREAGRRGSRGSSAAGCSACRVARSLGCSQCSHGAVASRKRDEAGKHAVGQQQALEVVLVCRPAWPPASRRTPRWRVGAQRLRQRRQRLVVQRDGPRAAQLARASPGRPAAASRSSRRGRRPRGACRQSRAARSARARARRAPARWRAAPSASPSGWKIRHSSSRIAASPPAIRYWASASSGQNTMSPCESPGTDAALALEEHEPLRPVAVGILALAYAQQQLAHRLPCGRARAATRPDPGTRRACPSRRPSTARGRAARDSGSSASCASQGRMACRRASRSTDAGASSTSGPVMPCQKRAAVAASLAHRSAASGLTSSGGASTQLPGDAQADRVAGAVIDTTKGWPRERPSVNSNSSPPTRSIAVPGATSMRNAPSGKRRPDVGVGQAATITPRAVARPARGHRRPSRRRRSARRGGTRESGTGRRPARATVEPTARADRRAPSCAPRAAGPRGVDPAAAAGRHLEGGRLAEQVPGAVHARRTAAGRASGTARGTMRVVERKRLMLTCPCVTIEWNTPPIHAVDVSDASSGMSWSPVRRICPWGRKHAQLLGRQHDVRAVGPEEGEQFPALVLGRQAVGAEVPCQHAGDRAASRQAGVASLKSVAARADAAPAFMPARHGFGQRQRSIDERRGRPAPLTPG